MRKAITCFMPWSDEESVAATIGSLRSSGLVNRIYILAPEGQVSSPENIEADFLPSNGFVTTEALKLMAAVAETEYVVTYSKRFPLDLGKHAFERMIQIAGGTGAGMVYSDYFEKKDGLLSPHPLIDYQEGSLRDDFNFGSVILYSTEAFMNACSRMDEEYSFAGLYDLRLKISQSYPLFHIQEMLYSEVETDTRKSGEKQFDYVDPRNRKVQIEMEKACTNHLKTVGAWLGPVFSDITFDDPAFDFDASVVIPVRNRVKTIGDAIRSVLYQKTLYRFNLIIVDNHSSDGTTEAIRSYKDDPRVVHIIPSRNDLGIGGCWNEAIFSGECGKFAIQLDSDDLYIDDSVITRIVDAFYDQKCAMVVGSYKMVNFDLEEILPGLIDHREWTPDNGRNNALRINGLGAPRAFYTPVLRKITVPNVSYGEDYAVGLAISRSYRIGRIYEPLYLCRRWDENSDALLDTTRINTYNSYKDKIRTIELIARKRMKSGIGSDI